MQQIADIARLFGVEKEMIKKWCFEFSEYLSPSALVKGKMRLFNDSDIRVFALIYEYWEDEPDYENIRIHLNSGDYNCEEFFEFNYLNTQIFKNASECNYMGDEAWTKGILLEIDTPKVSEIEIARSYKNAADVLVEHVRESHEPYDLSFPIFFTYRHSLELYLKILGRYNRKTDHEHHFIDKLIDKIEIEYNEKIPQWMRDRLYDFHNIDPKSTSFRYSEDIQKNFKHNDDLWIELDHLQFVMNKLCGVLEKVINKITL